MNEWLKNDKPLAGQMGDGAYDLPPSAGRELDARIARDVMGWTNVRYVSTAMLRGNPPEYPNIGHEVPCYSTDREDAWLVVERLRKDGWNFEMYTEHEASYVGRFYGRHELQRRSDVDLPVMLCKSALDARAAAPGRAGPCR